MNIVSILPESKKHWLELRSKVITSTEASALFNLNPYMTQFELWHRKKNLDIVEIDENERMKWGNYLQDAIASGIAQENNWQIRPMKEFLIDTDLQAGSSFDFEITSEPAILEIKNVDSLAFDRSWTDDEAPAHIEIQVQHQLMLTGHSKAYIGALVGGNKQVLIKRSANKNIQTAIASKVKSFYESIKNGIQPEIDFKRDAKFIQSLHNYAEPNTVLNVDDSHELSSLVAEYKQVSKEIDYLDDKKTELKSKMLQLINENEKVKGPGFSISAGVIGETTVSYTRKAYRNFKVNFKKEGKNEG